MTRSDGSEKSTLMPRPTRLKSSIPLNRRMLRQALNWSCMKSLGASPSDECDFPLQFFTIAFSVVEFLG